MGNLHLRFDEGRVGRAQASPSLLLYPRSYMNLSAMENIPPLRATGSEGLAARRILARLQLDGEDFFYRNDLPKSR